MGNKIGKEKLLKNREDAYVIKEKVIQKLDIHLGQINQRTHFRTKIVRSDWKAAIKQNVIEVNNSIFKKTIYNKGVLGRIFPNASMHQALSSFPFKDFGHARAQFVARKLVTNMELWENKTLNKMLLMKIEKLIFTKDFEVHRNHVEVVRPLSMDVFSSINAQEKTKLNNSYEVPLKKEKIQLSANLSKSFNCCGTQLYARHNIVDLNQEGLDSNDVSSLYRVFNKIDRAESDNEFDFSINESFDNERMNRELMMQTCRMKRKNKIKADLKKAKKGFNLCFGQSKKVKFMSEIDKEVDTITIKKLKENEERKLIKEKPLLIKIDLRNKGGDIVVNTKNSSEHRIFTKSEFLINQCLSEQPSKGQSLLAV